MSGRFRRLIAAGVMTLAALTGCGSDPVSDEETPVVTPTAVTPSGPQAAKAVRESVDAYQKLLNAFVAASNEGAVNSTEMATYGSGRALRTLQSLLSGYRSSGVHSKGSPRIVPPTITSLTPADDPASVKVVGCIDQSDWQFYHSDGKPADMNRAGQPATQQVSAVSATIDKNGSGWKVTDLVVAGACPS